MAAVPMPFALPSWKAPTGGQKERKKGKRGEGRARRGGRGGGGADGRWDGRTEEGSEYAWNEIEGRYGCRMHQSKVRRGVKEADWTWDETFAWRLILPHEPSFLKRRSLCIMVFPSPTPSLSIRLCFSYCLPRCLPPPRISLCLTTSSTV